MSTIDTSTWSPDSSLNTDIGGIPLNADASIQQTWQVIQMLMAALKGDTAAIELTINQPDGTTIVATNQTLTVVDNGHAHTIANIAGLQTALNGKAASSHSHAGTEIALTGYAKPSSASAVVATDTANVAIGKLEKGLDGKIELPANVSNPTRTVLCADGVWRDISQIAFPL